MMLKMIKDKTKHPKTNREELKNLHYYQETFNPLTTNVPHHIETSQLICIANQLAGFYMMGNIGR